MLIERDLIKDNQYDLVYKSKVKFDYQEDGNYNSQIMQFLNYVMGLANQEIIDTHMNAEEKKLKTKRVTMKKCFETDI